MSVNVVGFLESTSTTTGAFNLIDADTSIYFAFSDSSSLEIWKTEGEETGIFQVFPPSNSEELENLVISNLGVAGDSEQLLFAASENEFGNELWISDGTPEGTRILKDIHPNGSSNPANFFELDGTFYFTAEDGTNPRGLWKSDGTSEGTVLVTSNLDQYRNPTDFNGNLFFELNGSLWKSDGTPEGTVLVVDNVSNNGRPLSSFIVVDETLYFTTNIPGQPTFIGQLWKSNGTTEGTQLVAELPGLKELTSVDDTLFFVQGNEDIGEELWKSDGTPEGTVLVKDIRPEERVNGVATNFGSEPKNLIDVDGTLFFTADDGENGRELWKSDGTEEGTVLVENIAEDTNSNSPSGISIGELPSSQPTSVDGILYFTYNGQLWQSDGTDVNTFPIAPEEVSLGGEQVVDSFRFPNELLEFNDQLYFTGQAYSIEEGGYQPALLTLEDVDNTIVYRLFDPSAGVHFYTTDASERDEFIATGNYQSEGESYRSVEPSMDGAEEVFRFFNETTGVHLYTTNEVERDVIIETLPDFTFQGARFSAYETEVEGSIPIYRFYEPSIGVHLYTPSKIERDVVQADLPNYTFEGIAYYALPLEAEEL